MLSSLHEHGDGAEIEADIAVIGAGAAGITLARALRGHARKVVLVESGGKDYAPGTQDLCEGRVSGAPYYRLRDARLRFFGGTTAIWGGRCIALDPIDFEARDWVGNGGWPFPRAALARHYAAAARGLGLRFDPTDEALSCRVGPPAPAPLAPTVWQFDDAYWRFGLDNCRDLVAAPDCHILLNANLVDIETGEGARHVRCVRLAGLDGHRAVLRARTYALACGGIENARLLLAARGTMPGGLGNAHDMVGRGFMEHPRAALGLLRGPGAARLWSAWRARRVSGVKLAPALRLSDAAQRRHRTLNAALTLKYRPKSGRSSLKALYEQARHRAAPDRAMRRLWQLRNRANEALRAHVEGPLRAAQIARGDGAVLALLRCEQPPDPANRVGLIEGERDALGLPRARLDWRIGAAERHTARVMADALETALDRAGIDEFERAGWLDDPDADWPADPTISSHPFGGYHHMGTTRMHPDPRHGVVDADCRLHGVDNLYIAGSSVFPTGGWSNPTLTIIALALRLAEHLRAAPDRAGAATAQNVWS